MRGATRARREVLFWHDPDRSDDLAEAQRLGGLRRKRERTVAAAYDFSGLGSVEAIRRILEIATLDALGLENSIARGRLLISAAQAATKLLETGELAERLAALEATHRSTEPISGADLAL